MAGQRNAVLSTDNIEINLLDFFRTGKFSSVGLGASRESVLAAWGEPDRWINENGDVNKKPFDVTKATLWGYGPIEIYWIDPSAGLHMIYFQVSSLGWTHPAIKIDRWIFRKNKGVSWTAPYLKAALEKAEIPYQDTGLEIVSFEKDEIKVRPFTKNTFAEYDPDYVFGTLVLKVGVQVRYGEDDYLIKVAIGGSWTVKGSEQNIKWE